MDCTFHSFVSSIPAIWQLAYSSTAAVPDMTYKVFGRTLSLTLSINLLNSNFSIVK